MEVEDVIELGSSDEESEVPPRKKMKAVENAMVHIPSKIHGVTIKPVKVNSANTQKLFSGKNITVTKIPKPTMPAQTSATRPLKTQNKPLKGVTKKKVAVKSNIVHSRIIGINPLVKKLPSQTFVNHTVTKLQTPIPIANLPALKKLPPSVTIKKTGSSPKAPGNVIHIAKITPKYTNTIRKRKAPVLQTVELDDDEPQPTPNCPQWYVTPEELAKANDPSAQENINNKEPEKPTYIEITIEDSPIKPPKTKRTRELSIENVVTIEDSPNKDGTNNADPDDGSDEEPNTSKKTPHSKKKLEYEHKLHRIEETHTFEIEIDPIAINEPICATEKEDKILTLKPNIVEVEESAIEITKNQQGAVSVVIVETEEAGKAQNHQRVESIQPKPAQSKEVAEPSTAGKDNDENEFSSTYLSFINLCLQLENSDDMKKIVEKKIKTYYRQVPKEYTQSEEFIDMVSSKVSAIKAAPEKMYLYIKDIVDELNLQRKLAKQMPVVEEKPKEPETFSLGKDGGYDPSKRRQIRKLEKTLKKLNRAIHKLEMQEVDFDDDEDSVYLLTEKYKEKMVRVHAKFCQLTNSKLPSEPRLVIEARPGLAPGPAKRLEAWINRNNTLTFPDFHDVLRCVKEANVEDKLDWTDAFVMEEARDLFIRCGKKLQRRRQEKEWRTATSRVTLMEDPAEQSSELKKRLEDNRRVASTKENELLNMFSDRQNQLKLEAVDINDKEAEESPDESEEEENDESLSLESKQRRKERLKRLLQDQAKKNNTNKSQAMETDSNELIVSDVQPDDNKAESANKDQAPRDDNSIQSLSDDDSNEISSDVDELHLLQKLHSDHERRSDTSAESSDSETAIAISDTLDSSSDESNKDVQEEPCDIISIENSSYSDESDSQQSNEKTNKKKPSIVIEEIIEDSMVIDCSPEVVAKDTCLTNDAMEDVLLISPNTESNASKLLSSESTKSGKDTCSTNYPADALPTVTKSDASKSPENAESAQDSKSSEECLQDIMKKTPEKDLTTISKSSALNNIGIANDLENNEKDRGMNSNILDKNTDCQVTSIKNSALVPESNVKALGSDSIVEDDLVNPSTCKQSTDACKSDNKKKSQSHIPEDVEEPVINSISQAHTIDDSEFSLIPLSVDSRMNSTQDDAECMDVSMLASQSISFDSNEILAASSGKLLENETCNETTLGVGTESMKPMEGVEVSDAFKSGDVCTEAETGSEILISNVVSIRKPDLTDETLKENLNPNQDLDDSMILDSGSQISTNGNSNEDSSDLLQNVTKNDTTDSDLQESTVITEKSIPEQTVDCVEKKTGSQV